MINKFATRILSLRKEAGISQKEAAQKMGISQALLSHYEKGIRECSLDFVCKISSFYDVSSDYLLGIIDTRRTINEDFDKTESPQDTEFRTSTLFRAAAILHDNISELGNVYDEKTKNYFTVAIYGLIAAAVQSGVISKDWIKGSPTSAISVSSILMMKFLNIDTQKNPQKIIKPIEQPTCIKTVAQRAELLIADYIKEFL